MINLFDTREKADEAIAAFHELKAQRGWIILKEIVDANIEVLKTQLEEGTEGETKDDIDRRRDKLKAYRNIIGTPDYWIKALELPETIIEDGDPYITSKDL